MRQAPDASLRRGSAAALRGAHVRRQRYVQRLPLRSSYDPLKDSALHSHGHVCVAERGRSRRRRGVQDSRDLEEAQPLCHPQPALDRRQRVYDSDAFAVCRALCVSANPESITVADKFDASINDSHVFATSGYTTIIPTSESEALVGYNRCKPQLSILWLLTRRSRNDYCHRLPARRRRAWLLQGKRGGLLNGVCHEALAPQKGAGGQG